MHCQSWRDDTVWTDSVLPKGLLPRGRAKSRRGLHILQFPPCLTGTQEHPPSLPSSLHYHQILFLGFTNACGPIFFHSAPVSFLAFLSLLGLFSIYWFFLWLPTVNIVPTHSIKDLLFQKWHPTGGAVCPDRAFLAHRLGSHLLDPPKYWKDFII